MAHTNVQLVSGNLTTGQASPTFFIDRVNDKIGIGGVPVTSGDNSSNVLQVSGNMLATRYHGDGSSLTGVDGSRWTLTDDGINDGINYVGNVGIGGLASATAATKLYVYGDIDIQSGSSLRIGGVIPVYSNWASDANGINRTTGNVGIGGDASATNRLKVDGTVEATGLFSTRLWLTAVGDNSGNGTPDDDTGSPWYGLGYDNLAWNNQSYKYTDDIPILSGYSGVALRSGSGNLVLTTAGRVGIGTISPGYTLDVAGDIYATGDVTASSDRRLKTDIKRIENALDKVCSLGGYTYVMNDKPSSGLIAQEVLEVLPEVVHGSEETNYSLAYGNIVGLLVEAIKELKEKVG
jgi:hypothetical protein